MNQPAFKRIVTHTGKAHRDEFYTCCLILSQYPTVQIDRREPTPEELEDPEVIVLDIGGRHEPEKNNFDHHQFEPTEVVEDLRCTLSLWLENEDRLQKAREYWRWLPACEIVDCMGPYTLAKKIGTTWELLASTTCSPFEDFLLLEFGRRNTIRPGAYQDWLVQAMISFGVSSNHGLEEGAALLAELDNIGFTAEIQGLKVVGFNPHTFKKKHASRIDHWIKKHHPTAAIYFFPDDRGEPGTCIYRAGDHPRVDFCRLKGNPSARFIHKSGFIAKVVTQTSSEILELCALAIKP